MSPEARTLHLRPTAPLAERVLLPGDPGRALALAQGLLAEPRMFNHHRGLWGYTGATREGLEVTIQATGMGGPSAAIVLHELIELGIRCAVRVGSCGGLAHGLDLGDLVVAREAIGADGTSRALGVRGRIAADAGLAGALERAAPRARAGTVVSVDIFFEEDLPATRDRSPGEAALGSVAGQDGAGVRAHEHPDAIAVEMEAATLFALGAAAGVPVGCVLAVSDIFDATSGERRRISDEPLLESAEAMGRAALAALAEL